jgi:diguanylate cyclase (GGDEF)-like protein
LNYFGFSNGWTILWPLNGVTIAILIMRPRSEWPSMLLGIEVGTGFGEHFDNNVVNSLGPEILQRLMSLVEVTVSAMFLPAFSTLEEWLRKPRIFPRFVAALLIGPTVSGILAAVFFHAVTGQGYLAAFDDWAAADALGIAAIMPLALSFSSREMRGLFRLRSLPRTLAALALAFGSAAAVFTVSRYPLLFLLFPAILLADGLLGFAGSAIAVFGVSLIAVYYTTLLKGPFGVWPRDLAVTSNVALQLYLGFELLALFPASLMLLERKRMGSELQNTNAQLLLLASLDGLTGIPNRRSFDEYFAQEWNRAIRLQTPLAFIMMDIDHFKQFNDIYGHHAGDQCLQAVAQALKGEVQRAQDHLARFGGEEFSLLLPHTDLDGAIHLAEQLRMAIMELRINHRGSSTGQVTISLGCAALTPANGEDRTHLLQIADAALYEAKRSGRNRSFGSPLARETIHS